MPYSITRENAAEDLRVLRAVITVASGFVDKEAVPMQRLHELADSIEEQVEPVVDEPTEFGSMVQARWIDAPDYTAPLPWIYTPWQGEHRWRSADGLTMVWSDLTDIEELRIGVGEAGIPVEKVQAQQADFLMRASWARSHGDADSASVWVAAADLLQYLLPEVDGEEHPTPSPTDGFCTCWPNERNLDCGVAEHRRAARIYRDPMDDAPEDEKPGTWREGFQTGTKNTRERLAARIGALKAKLITAPEQTAIDKALAEIEADVEDHEGPRYQS